MRVAATAHFAEHVHALGQLVFAAPGRERQLTVLHIRRPVDHPLVEPGLGEEDAVFHARRNPKGYTSARRMGVIETAARIVQLGGAASKGPRVAEMRSRFEARTGAFSPDDAWFEERSRAFWCDAISRGLFGRDVEGDLAPDERAWLRPLERAHRGLFRASTLTAAPGRHGGPRMVLEDAWSGAEVILTLVDDASRAELDAAAGQLFDARVVGAHEPLVVALLPGAVFHSPDATAAIDPVLAAARKQGLSTHDTLDALLRMERTRRALSRVKVSYAYRPEALALQAPAGPTVPVRRTTKAPT